MILEKIAEAVKSYLKAEFDTEIEDKQIQLDKTRKDFEGDYTLVVFPFVRAMRTKPEMAAEAIGKHLESMLEEVTSYNVIKGFLNLNLSAAYWGETLSLSTQYPAWLGRGKDDRLILVEYSSPNTNKPLHLGHLRNNFLGHSVSLIRDFSGQHVVKTQIINDRGVHICKSMLAWQKFGEGQTPESLEMKGDKLVGSFYVKYDQELKKQVAELTAKGMDEDQAKKEAPLSSEVQEMLVKWEQGEPETIALWEKMNGWVYRGFDATYERMGVEFDKLYYESDTYKKGKDIVLRALETETLGFYRKEDGSVWADLSGDGLDQKLLIRADGTTVYMTQDIGTAVQRYEDYPELSQVIYTVGDEQDYHFKVLFLILEKLGYQWATNCRHLSYGMVDLPSGKMKSREGTVVDADDLMEEVVKAARESSMEKGKLEGMSPEEQDKLFNTLGLGALRFFLLRVDPKKRMLFDPAESVSLQGDTGPFVQYTHARCRAVLRKAGEFSPGLPPVIDAKERTLLRELMDFRNVTQEAADQMNPALIASYCLDLAKFYNQFYHDLPILKAEGAERDFRLGLTALTSDTIRTAMGLLGIQVPERM